MVTYRNMGWTFCAIAIALLCAHVTIAGRGVRAVPIDGKAESHEHWEHIVRRSAAENWDPHYVDDTAHIVNVQEYYRDIFTDVSNNDVHTELQAYHESKVNVGPRERRIKGRYIVMFTPDASDYVLDRTIEVLEKVNIETEQRLRATDITPFRYVQKGFTATLNSKTVEAVRIVTALCLHILW